MNKTVILYSTGCPKCEVLKKKLEQKEVNYKTVCSVEEMTELGITTVPVLGVDDNLLEFGQAVEWVNKL